MDEQTCPKDGVPTVLRAEEAEAPRDPLLGKIFSERFRVEEVLGEGGMGRIYTSTQLSMDRKVALKVLHGKFQKDRKRVARFYQEARSASSLTSPHVVRIYDFGVDDATQQPFIAMELLHGITLEERLDKDSCLPPKDVFKIVRQICLALLEAESCGLVHRDLKPENIFLCDQIGAGFFVKVMDFGIAKVRAEEEKQSQALTRTGMTVGTPTYMPPEQISGKDLDSRTDMYALGCIFYEMLTGQPPFWADDVMALLLAHVQQPPPELPEMLASGVRTAEGLEHLIHDLLAKNKEHRPATVQAIIDQVDVLAKSAPTSTTDELAPPSLLSTTEWNGAKTKKTVGPAPSGLVTLVFTDIEDSTELWEFDTNAMQAALQIHDQVIRTQILGNMGYEVKNEGDSFMVAFASPVTAVEWALNTQRALFEAPWPSAILKHPICKPADGFNGLRVRMGIYVGEPICKTDPTTGRMDYFGPSVNRAARVAAAAHGGQILLAGPVWETVRNNIKVVSVDLGEHRLRGLEHPERLIQVIPGDLPTRTFPDLATLSVQKTNLQNPPTSFVGRQDDLDQIESLFDSGARMVTVLGPGGMGKTRLVMQFGHQQIAEYNRDGGVWFCDLSETRDAFALLESVGRALDVPLTESTDLDGLVQRLGDAMAGRGKMLLILDNFEQVVDSASQTVGHWLRTIPNVCFLVGSRSRLKVSGENIYSLEPLPLHDATSLFAQRALSARSTFEMSVEDAHTILEIAKKLDGIPLAIELAAARVGVLSPAQILKRLDQRFRLLRRRKSDLPGRQETLRGAIDWSWDLLEPWEQDAMAQFSVFRGGFFLEAAEAIIDVEQHEEDPWALDVVESLKDKSLLRSQDISDIPDEARFGMYESIREYAAEKLEASGQRRRFEERHEQYFVPYCASLSEQLNQHGGLDRRRRLEQETDNLLSICERNQDTNPEVSLQAILALEPIIRTRGPFGPMMKRANECLEKNPTPSTLIHARVLRFRAWLSRNVGAIEAAWSDLSHAITIAEDQNDMALQSMIIADQGILNWWRGTPEDVERYLSKSLEMAQKAKSPKEEARALGNLAALYGEMERTGQAEQFHKTALDMDTKNGNLSGMVINLIGLGNLFAQQARWDEAEPCLQKAIEIERRLGNRQIEGMVEGNLGVIRCEKGEYERAFKSYRNALNCFQELGDYAAQATFLAYLIILESGQNDLESAKGNLERLSALVHHQNRDIGDFGDLPASHSDATTGLSDPRASLFFQLAKAGVELATARNIERDGTKGDAVKLRESGNDRLQKAHELGSPDAHNPEGTPSPSERWSDVRVMLRLIESQRPGAAE